MKYSIQGKSRSSTVITNDGVVVWAESPYEWLVSVRMDVRDLVPWLRRKGLVWECTGADCEAPR